MLLKQSAKHNRFSYAQQNRHRLISDFQIEWVRSKRNTLRISQQVLRGAVGINHEVIRPVEFHGATHVFACLFKLNIFHEKVIVIRLQKLTPSINAMFPGVICCKRVVEVPLIALEKFRNIITAEFNIKVRFLLLSHIFEL